MLKNYMEIVVDEMMPDVLDEKELSCNCQHCIEDIKAITLNNLKPMYVVSKKGILYTKLNEFSIQFRADITKELVSAIEMVKNNPRHEDER